VNTQPSEDIEAEIPESVRSFVRVTCYIGKSDAFSQLCRAIGEAFSRFQLIPRQWRQIDLIVGPDRPFVNTPVGMLVLVPKEGIAAMTMGDVIVLRAPKLLASTYEFQVLAVLEELTHSVLNIADESLASWVVSFLFSDKIAYQCGSYVSTEDYVPHWPPKAKDWEALYSAKPLDLSAQDS